MRLARFLLPAIALMALLSPASVQASNARMTAGDLANLCVAKSDLDFGYCTGYIMAIADKMVDNQIGPYRACNHAQVRPQQYIDVYRSYAEIFPETLRGDAETAVAAALARAFPCLGN
jgi:hypothetical protein